MKKLSIDFLSIQHLVFISLIFIGLIGFHIFGYYGHFGFDDIYYAKLSYSILSGNFVLSLDHYAYRWGILIPQALFFKLFGMNDHSAAITPFLFTLGTCILVLLVTKNEKWYLKLLALTVLITSHWVLFYSDKIMPDIIVMFFITGLLVILYANYFTSFSKKPIAMGMFFSIVFFLGFITKETIFMITPWILYYFITDIYHKRNFKFWVSSFWTLSIIMFIYHLFIYYQTGNLFQRFRAIEAGSYFNPCSYSQMPFSITLERIGYELFLLLIRTRDLIGLVFVIPYLLKNKSDLLSANSAKGFLFGSLILFLLCSNFMTASPTAYNPLCLDPRHYLYLMPIMAIATAYSLEFWLYDTSIKTAISATIISLIFMVIAIHYAFESVLSYEIIFVICSLKLFFCFVQFRSIASQLLMISIFLTLLITPKELIVTSKYSNYKIQKRLIYQQLIHTNKSNSLVITNTVQKNFGEYYFNFDTSKVRFINYKELDKIALNNYKEIFLLRNPSTESLCNLQPNDIPDYIYQSEFKGECLFNDSDIRLFKIKPNK